MKRLGDILNKIDDLANTEYGKYRDDTGNKAEDAELEIEYKLEFLSDVREYVQEYQNEPYTIGDSFQHHYETKIKAIKEICDWIIH